MNILSHTPFTTQKKMSPSTSAVGLVWMLCSVGKVAALSTRLVTGRGSHQASAALTTLSGAWKTCLDMEAADTQFWASEWEGMESELLQLQAAAVGQVANKTAAQQAAAVERPANKSSIAGVQPVAKATKHPKHFNPLAGIKLNLEPKTPADLAPALAMLTGLYEDGKERIAKLNAREQDFKQKYLKTQATHEQRIKTIEARVKNGTLSKEFAANETRDEGRLWTYWKNVRERQHRTFHTSLKIQHSTLTKEKQMIDMYEKTIAGKESKKELAKEFSKVGGTVPEVVFFQEVQRGIVKFCHDELAEVRSEHAAMLQTRKTINL